MKIPILGNHHKIKFPMDRSHSKHLRIEYIQGIQIYPQNYHHNGLDIDGDQDNDNIADWIEEIATDNWAWFTRGYTGHEMLPEFGLINMNGRAYDPVLGRMLQVDNYIQNPFSSQSYNRYSYVLNNPLKYVDPSGELGFFVIPGVGHSASGYSVSLTVGVGVPGVASVQVTVGHDFGTNNTFVSMGASLGLVTASIGYGTNTGAFRIIGIGLPGVLGFSTNLNSAGVSWSQESGVSFNFSVLALNRSASGLGYTISPLSVSYSSAFVFSGSKPIQSDIYYDRASDTYKYNTDLMACHGCGDYSTYHLPEVLIHSFRYSAVISNYNFYGSQRWAGIEFQTAKKYTGAIRSTTGLFAGIYGYESNQVYNYAQKIGGKFFSADVYSRWNRMNSLKVAGSLGKVTFGLGLLGTGYSISKVVDQYSTGGIENVNGWDVADSIIGMASGTAFVYGALVTATPLGLFVGIGAAVYFGGRAIYHFSQF